MTALQDAHCFLLSAFCFLSPSLSPQMPPHRHRASEETDETTGEDAEKGEGRGEEGGLYQVAIDGGVGEPDEEQSYDAADDSLEEAVDQEGAAHKAVGGTDETHYRDLALARE